jgi:hypothetical protein
VLAPGGGRPFWNTVSKGIINPMELSLAFRPTRICTSTADDEGLLVLANDALAGVLVRLSPTIHEEGLAGRWFLEVSFGRCPDDAPLFDTLESADRWFRVHLAPCA